MEFKSTKDYSQYHTVEYPEGSGKQYIFDPYNFGYGSWAVLTPQGKPGKYLEKSLQAELNEFFFSREELPSLYERFTSASKEERERLKDISIGWLQLKIKATQANNLLPRNTKERTKQFVPGGMYFFVYDAKHKNTLPVWDKFPLVIVLDKTTDGFLGLNLHYLHGLNRVRFLSHLLNDLSVYNRASDILRLQITYNTLKYTNQYKDYKVCIKKYLTDHLRSKVLPIESHEWNYAAILPIEKFQYKK